MALTEEEIGKIADKLASRLIANARCDCNLSPEQQKEMGHLVGMLRDTGDGDMSRGVEIFREIGKRFAKLTKISDWTSRIVLTFVLMTVLGVGYLCVKEGFKLIVGGWK